LNRPLDGPFEEELEEFMESLEGAAAAEAPEVVDVLGRTKAILAVQILFQDRGTTATSALLDPLWRWLRAHHHGLVHLDGEGFYDRDGHPLRRQD